jgi:hypothetical protein
MGKVITLAVAISALGCAGAMTSVVAPDAQVPVSMSRAVRDADGGLVTAERRKVVGHFHDEPTAWSLFYTAVALTPRTDISHSVNTQVAHSRGQAVTNLRVRNATCGLTYLVFPFGLLPIWPGCSNLEIDGDIITVESPSPATLSVEHAGTGGAL